MQGQDPDEIFQLVMQAFTSKCVVGARIDAAQPEAAAAVEMGLVAGRPYCVVTGGLVRVRVRVRLTLTLTLTYRASVRNPSPKPDLLGGRVARRADRVRLRSGACLEVPGEG